MNMKNRLKSIAIGFLVTIVMFHQSSIVWGLENPIEQSNNKLGIHILDPIEIDHAPAIVNGNDNRWGYVVVPLRVDDRDLDKWFNFFVKARDLKLIPVVRLAMHGENNGWAIPTDDEILYAANFLNQMPWPIKNRYVIVFNEPNHALEWGGILDPASYAERLNFAIDVFKSKDANFFMLNAALDRATPNQAGKTMKADTYLKGIFESRPELVYKIDGWNSHAYPNPAFARSPNERGTMSVVSYRSELSYLQKLGRDNIPVFITETNWTNEKLSAEQISEYWKQAWNYAWVDRNLVMIGAWLLNANDGPFAQVSLTDRSFKPNLIGETIRNLPREKGDPVVSPAMTIVPAVISSSTVASEERGAQEHKFDLSSLWTRVKSWFSDEKKSEVKSEANLKAMWLGNNKIMVEIADDIETQTLGLGYRTHMDYDKGMLFRYKQAGYPIFWMKETLIPLDMVWINDNKIVDITHDIPVDSNPSDPKGRYGPKNPAIWVLETNAGWAKANGIEIGDQVKLDE